MSACSPRTLADVQTRTWIGENGILAVCIAAGHGRFRITVNDATIWDQTADEASPAEKLAAAEAEKRDLVAAALRLKNKAIALNAVINRVRTVVRRNDGGTRSGRARTILDEISTALSLTKDTKDITLTATLNGVLIGDRDFTAGTNVTVPTTDADRLIAAGLAKENTHDA